MNLVIEIVLWIAYVVSLYFSVFLFLVFMDNKKLFHQEQSSTTLSQYPLVSILIPAYNEEETIIRTLKSVDALDYPKEKLEIIIIDDGSKDKTKELIEVFIHGKPYCILLSHTNRGKAASLNRGLSVAKGEFFACLDADSFVEPLTLRKMLSLYFHANDQSLAVVTPAMKVDTPRNILQRVQWLEYLVIILIARMSSQLDSLYVAPGPFSLYRTAIIREVGGFDEKNITEDQEIAYRLQKHQYRIRQCFDGYVYTTAPQNIRPFYQQRRRWYLGSILCLHKYRKIIANRKYGDFGVYQTVKSSLGFVLAVTGILVGGYLILEPLLRAVRSLAVVNFNPLPFLLNMQFKINLLALLLADFRQWFLVVILFLLGLFFFYQAHRNAKERMMRFGWLPLIPYFVFYYLLKGAILLLSLAEFSRGRKTRW